MVEMRGRKTALDYITAVIPGGRQAGGSKRSAGR